MTLIRQLGKAVFATADLFLPTPRGPRILIYHQVGADLGRQMEVTLEDFVWQLDWLEEKRQVVSLDEALQRWEEPGSERLVVLTFDDGYRDTYSTAFPILKERGMPFVLYLATEAIETGNGLSGAEPLTWHQVEGMMDTGLVTIGAHTHTHVDLRSLDIGEITREIETCNGLLESRLGSKPSHFAYPWGYWASGAEPVIRGQYSSAVLGAPVPRSPVGTGDPFLIHRYPIQSSDRPSWFSARIRGGLLAEESMRRWMRGYRGP